MEYIKNDITIRALYKFSDSKDPSEYSLGGEDGLEETPYLLGENGVKNFQGTPNWSDFSIYAIKKISSNSTLRLGLTNIFDIHYKTFASGISSPGRSFQAGLNLKL